MGYTLPHFIQPVSVASGHSPETQTLGDPAGHVVLRVGDFAVVNLQAVHMLEHGPFAGLFYVQLKLADPEKEKPAEGMGGDHQSADCFDLFAQVLDGHDALYIFFIPKNQDIPLVGGNLVPLEDPDSMVLHQFLDFFGGPPVLMFC
jgi:hypothetical protein